MWVSNSPLFGYLQRHHRDSHRGAEGLHDMAASAVLTNTGDAECQASSPQLFATTVSRSTAVSGHGESSEGNDARGSVVTAGSQTPAGQSSLSLNFLFTKLWFLSSRRILDLSVKLGLNSTIIQQVCILYV